MHDIGGMFPLTELDNKYGCRSCIQGNCFGCKYNDEVNKRIDAMLDGHDWVTNNISVPRKNPFKAYRFTMEGI